MRQCLSFLRQARTFLEQEQGVRFVALLDDVVAGGHDQRGEAGGHEALAGVVHALEDVAVPEDGPRQLQRHVRAQRCWQLGPEHVIVRICQNKSKAQDEPLERASSRPVTHYACWRGRAPKDALCQ